VTVFATYCRKPRYCFERMAALCPLPDKVARQSARQSNIKLKEKTCTLTAPLSAARRLKVTPSAIIVGGSSLCDGVYDRMYTGMWL
jgi:hypothetical protein